MKAPISWLAEHVDLPRDVTPRALGDALIRIGMEVESVESGADGLSGPIVVGRVFSIEDEPQKNGKTIRWCQVDVGADEPRGIVCGAHNFGTGDLVVVSLPGAVLPGGFAITARKTYGHVSDGMICSVRELGIGDDHEGILVLPPGSAEPGDDPLEVLGLRDAVLDVAVTTDRGYCLSVRGLAREAAAALDVAFRDIEAELPDIDGGAYDVRIDDPSGCDRFSARAVSGLDPAAPTPDWMARRLRQGGIRSISLPVDVTNYVMLETGQPLHAFDRAKLTGPVVVRRAQPGERLKTLDGKLRALDPDDMVVADDTGAIALAGVMGGASTEIGAATDDVLLEAAHWEPDSIARTVRRHREPSEAARRFERNVDPEIAGVALARCVELLVAHGGATAVPGYTVVGTPVPPPVIALAARRPEVVAGMPIPRPNAVAHLERVGCEVAGGDVLEVRPPSWRPDLVSPADLVEEVVRLAGYDRLPSVLPAAPAGRGLTPRQALSRAISRTIAEAGFVEVLTYPFVAPSIHDAFGLPDDDPRRASLRLVNPALGGPARAAHLAPAGPARHRPAQPRARQPRSCDRRDRLSVPAPIRERHAAGAARHRGPAHGRTAGGPRRGPARPAAPSRRRALRRPRASRLVGPGPAGRVGRRGRGGPGGRARGPRRVRPRSGEVRAVASRALRGPDARRPRCRPRWRAASARHRGARPARGHLRHGTRP